MKNSKEVIRHANGDYGTLFSNNALQTANDSSVSVTVGAPSQEAAHSADAGGVSSVVLNSNVSV